MTSEGSAAMMELPGDVSMPVIEHTLIITHMRGNPAPLGKWSRATALPVPDSEHFCVLAGGVTGVTARRKNNSHTVMSVA
jgi:hypothetical protein